VIPVHQPVDPTPEEPRLSVILPWRDRDEIATSLTHNAAQLAACAAEVVVVNDGGSGARLRELIEPPDASGGVPGAAGPALDVKLVEVTPASPSFNKSRALNLGVALARARNLFLLDVDVLLEEGVIARALEVLDDGCFVTIERVLESERGAAGAQPTPQLRSIAHRIELVSADRTVEIETNRLRLIDGARSGPGLIFLRRKRFLEVGGMCSDLEGWGWADLDLVARLQLALGLERRTCGQVVHLTHGDDKRALQGVNRGASEARNQSRAIAHYALGYTAGTFREDVERYRTSRLRSLSLRCQSR